MREQTRREFLQSCFRLAGGGAAGLAAIHALGLSAVEDARALGIFSQFMSGETGCVSGNDSNTVLLIHSNSTSGSVVFVDSGNAASCPHAITVSGTVRHTTTFSKFGPTSICFDGGILDFLQVNDCAELDLAAGDFCVELWLYFAGALPADAGLIGRYDNTAGNWGLQFGSAYGVNWYYGPGAAYTKAWTPSINTWHHAAVNRISGTLRFFADGLQRGTSEADAINYDSAGVLRIGDYLSAGGSSFAGYMVEIAIHKGDGVYPPGGFTPNAGAYCD